MTKSLHSYSICVIICAYTETRWLHLVKAVDSLTNQTLKSTQIVVVIDYNDNLLDRAKAEFGDNVTAVPNRFSKGLSGSRNTGLELNKSDIVAFLDDDAHASSDWLDNLVTTYDREQVVAAGGSIIPDWESNRPNWFPDEFLWVVGCTYRGLPEEPSRVRNVIGANMSFRSSAIAGMRGFREDVGRLDTIPLGCEETEYCVRLAQHRGDIVEIYYQPSAVVYHYVPTNRTTLAYFLSRCYSEGISKALISRYVGVQDATSSERKYLSVTIPKGIANSIGFSIQRRNLDGFKRMFALILGVIATGIGFIVGWLKTSVTQVTANQPERSQ